MSKSKGSSDTWKERQEFITKLVVESVETEFYIKKSQDDAGTHLMVYLPEEARAELDSSKFRNAINTKFGSIRVLVCFVHAGYIQYLLDS